jgi:predicted TIM-barrel fold metal-dependent hydrolase
LAVAALGSDEVEGDANGFLVHRRQRVAHHVQEVKLGLVHRRRGQIGKRQVVHEGGKRFGDGTIHWNSPAGDALWASPAFYGDNAAGGSVLIADAQAHIWGRVAAGAEAQAHRPEPFLAEELLARMDDAGVQRAVLVPTSWSDDNGNDLAVRAAQERPDRFVVFGVAPMAVEGREVIAGWQRTPGLMGVRASFHTEKLAPLLTDGSVDWLWPALERAGVPVMMYAPHQLAVVGRIAEAQPGLRIIVDHLGLPRVGGNVDVADHVSQLVRLARLPNVATKASALALYSRQPFPFEDMQPHVGRALDAFGPRRVFWGSDLSRQGCTYREALPMFTEHLPGLSSDELELLMGRALCDWIGWPLPGET